VNCLCLLGILAKLAMVDSLRFSLAASGAVQALIASTLPSMRGRDFWQTHANVARVLHRLAEVPSLHAFIAGLGLREWILDVMWYALLAPEFPHISTSTSTCFNIQLTRSPHSDPLAMPYASNLYGEVLAGLPP
jgi:hypothetical protein